MSNSFIFPICLLPGRRVLLTRGMGMGDGTIWDHFYTILRPCWISFRIILGSLCEIYICFSTKNKCPWNLTYELVLCYWNNTISALNSNQNNKKHVFGISTKDIGCKKRRRKTICATFSPNILLNLFIYTESYTGSHSNILNNSSYYKTHSKHSTIHFVSKNA